jgi:hypothetical protein
LPGSLVFGGPKSALSAKKIGKWLYPSTLKAGTTHGSVIAGTEKAARFGS